MESQNKPVLIYDGDCNFCRHWVNRCRHLTQDRVEYLPSQDAAPLFSHISPEQFEASVQLVQLDGSVYDGAEAVFRALACNPKHGWPLLWYRKVPVVGVLTEFLYRFVARNRTAFSRLMQWL